MIDPNELREVFAHFIAEAEFDPVKEGDDWYRIWWDISEEFLDWLINENKYQMNRANKQPHELQEMMRLLDANS